MTNPTIAQREPYAVPVEAGKTYWWCACGRSKGQPFCDGSHKGTGIEPVPHTPKASGTAYFCGCKHSKAGALCDGSHNSC
jgi:CDGSH-type Zn-finger protein